MNAIKFTIGRQGRFHVMRQLGSNGVFFRLLSKINLIGCLLKVPASLDMRTKEIGFSVLKEILL